MKNTEGRLSLRERIGYGMGDFASNMVFAPLATMAVFYYTNIAGIATGTAVGIVAFSRILDAVSDILVGGMIDRMDSPHGKARPFIARMAIPLAVSLILLFSIPSALPYKGKLIWVFLTYNLVSTVFYTALNVPYATLSFYMTDSSEERARLNVFRLASAFGGQLLVNLTIIRMVRLCGRGSDTSEAGWTAAISIYAAAAVAAAFFCFFATKERVHPVRQGSGGGTGFREGFYAICHNPYMLLLSAASFIVYTLSSMHSGSAAYYAEYNLKDLNAYSTFSSMQTLMQVLSIIFFVPFLLKRMNKKRIYILGAAIATAGFAVNAFLPEALATATISGGLKGIGFGILPTMAFSMLADTIDYGEWKTGINCAGLGNAVLGCLSKLGMGLGTVLMGMILSRGGFSENLTVQPAGVPGAVRMAYILAPMAAEIAGIVIMLFYRLDDRYPQIMEELRRRREEKQ